jgi:sterol desaturase/sphingolipid hydroxylase (fatty acid hydroxylase superfamily)
MNELFDWIYGLSPPEAAGLLLVENVALFGLAVAIGCLMDSLFARRTVGPPPDPLDGREILYATTTVLLNWLVTVVGWVLWRLGVIVIRRDIGWYAWLDVLLLLLIMDFAMYVLHRVVHLPWFYPIHHLHHRYERPRPLDLFVLHPLENLSFGLLWLVVVAIHPWSILGMTIYLALNLGSGTLGHLGVEPFPAWAGRVPLLRQVGTSTFHAQHHQDIGHNFGFYTLIWDRLFGTLVPDYDAQFGQFPPPVQGQPAAVRRS